MEVGASLGRPGRRPAQGLHSETSTIRRVESRRRINQSKEPSSADKGAGGFRSTDFRRGESHRIGLVHRLGLGPWRKFKAGSLHNNASAVASAVTPKAANGGHPKTGQRSDSVSDHLKTYFFERRADRNRRGPIGKGSMNFGDRRRRIGTAFGAGRNSAR